MPHIAEIMGRYHLDTSKTWTDDDLLEPYNFKDEPSIYEIIDFLDNPYEHVTKKPFKVIKL